MARSPRPRSRQTSTTLAPSLASATEAAWPMPELAPVITQTRPAIGG
ncbi:MAG TPA: hypothetical protein VMU94_03015 [Streptosporangiaceae bacterium]|nr:hypothetical protein [Streptosporangiaceae bacterium]